ncbi:MAG TPA: FtsX-like permease family protein, partial [Candidatus Acidoferrales bacterium]
GYFRTMGMRLVAGRTLAATDRLSTPLVVVVNRALAERYWPGAGALGQQVFFAGREPFTVTGVVDDVKHNALSGEPPLEIYLAMSQIPPGNESWLGRSQAYVIRTRGNPADLAAAVQDLAVSVDRDQPVFAIQPMDRVLETSVAQPRFRAMLFVLFGAMALVLAVVGIYGVMAYSVAQRTQEIGIRMALGAQTADIARLVLGQGVALAVTGIVLGMGAAWGATRVMSAMLFGVAPTDVFSFAATAGLLAAVAVLACWLPARRATQVDPIVALRVN